MRGLDARPIIGAHRCSYCCTLRCARLPCLALNPPRTPGTDTEVERRGVEWQVLVVFLFTQLYSRPSALLATKQRAQAM